VAGTLEALQEQVKRGDDLARLAWADLCEEQGDLEAAAVLRALPELAEQMETQRRAVAASSGAPPNLMVSLSGEWAWETTGTATPQASPILRTLLDRMDEMRAALHWLAGRLGMGAVSYQAD